MHNDKINILNKYRNKENFIEIMTKYKNKNKFLKNNGTWSYL